MVDGSLEILLDTLRYWRIFHGSCAIAHKELFTTHQVTSTGTTDLRLPNLICELNVGIVILCIRCIKHWNFFSDIIVTIELFKRSARWLRLFFSFKH